MEHPGQQASQPGSLTRLALQTTLHCLTDCGIGEVLGLVIATALGWGIAASSAIAVVLVIPGAMDAGLSSILFWFSQAIALALAFLAAFPVNRWLINRGKGYAVVHEHHQRRLDRSQLSIA
jgi:hypothetical protein